MAEAAAAAGSSSQLVPAEIIIDHTPPLLTVIGSVVV